MGNQNNQYSQVGRVLRAKPDNPRPAPFANSPCRWIHKIKLACMTETYRIYRKNCDILCQLASAQCHQRLEVEHESFQGRQPVSGLSQAELPKKYDQGLRFALVCQNSGTIFLIMT